ncbi:MAG TPA: Ig-like domain-containing protein [Gaiellaceae bacterium]|nr:Ig-like domain-containing protein [Gaiellaceae bacterium]
MADKSILRRSRRTGDAGSTTPGFDLLLNNIRTATLLLLAAVLTLLVSSSHHTGNGARITSQPLPAWPKSNTLVAHHGDARASLTVRFAHGTSTATQRRLLARYGAVETGTVGALGLHVVSVDPATAESLLSALRSANAVTSVTPDGVRQAAGDESTNRTSSSWALDKIGSATALAFAKSKRDVTIAVLDTGVDAASVDGVLAGRSAFAGADARADPNGHGTWMASIARGVDPHAHILPVQVLDKHGLGKDSDIISGLVWAADQHANVIVMSFAGTGYSPALQRAVDYAWSKGSVVVAATGNSGSAQPTYPAGDANVVGVSATDSHDRLWTGSNDGADTFVAAPGVDVPALAAGGGSTSVTGTSAAAALVAGSAALLLGDDPKATNAKIVGRLAKTADPAGTRAQTGNGRINVANALWNRVASAVTPAGVVGRANGGPFVTSYSAASASTTPTAIGTATSTTGATITLTTTAAVPANSTVYIVVGEATTTTGGTWAATGFTQDVNLNGTANGRHAAILREFTTATINSGTAIAITKPVSGSAAVASAFYTQGIVQTTPLDKSTTSSSASSTAWTTGTTTATAQSAELDVAAGVVNSTSVSFGSPSCTAIGGNPASTIEAQAFYKAVAATGTQACTSTLSANSLWGGAIGTYKVDVTAPTANVTFPSAAAYNAAGWTGSVTGTAIDGSGGSGLDTTAGKNQLSIHDDTANTYWSGAGWGSVGGAETYFNPTTNIGTVAPGTSTTWSYTFANTNLTNGHTYTIHSQTVDWGGNTSAVDSQSFAYDTSAPSSATLTTNASYNAAGWSGHVAGTVSDSGTGGNGISAVNVSIADSVSGTCWNGTNFTTAACPNWVAVSSGGSATGTSNASWQYNLASTALTNGHTYTVSVQAGDAVTNANQSGTLSAGTFKYDTTAPAFGAISFTENGNCDGSLFESGATVYYRSAAATCANAFDVNAVVTDATSGPASVNFPVIATGSFAHTNETDSTGGSPYSSALHYGWTAIGATFSSTSSLTATDAAGNKSNTNVTITLDNTNPTGGSISVPAYATATSVTITSSNYSDARSGIATNVITRSAGQSPTGGVCPGSGYTGSTVVTSPDTGVTNGQCYVYTLTGTDNVGNVATVASSAVLVDTTAPTDAITLSSVSGGVYKSGTTVYYKGNTAGSFKLKDAVSDAASGPKSATFGLLSGGTGFSAHNSETINTPTAGPFVSTAISWTSASGGPTIPVNGTDKATNNSSATTLTLTLDNTVPTSGTISVPSYATATSVTITSGNYSDGGSGIATNVITRSAGRSPTAGACPGSGYTGATTVTSPDTGVVDGQCYVYTLTGTDNVGNTISTSSSPVMVDTTKPADAFTLTGISGGVFKSGTTIYYKGNTAGSFKLRDTVTDATSGPASATFGALAGGSGFSTHNSETISGPSPYDSTAITWTSASGAPTIPAHGTDRAGNSQNDTTFAVTLDNTAPTGGSISVPAYVSSTSVTITSGNYSDGGSGLAGGSNTITRSAGQSPTAGVCPGSGYTGATTVTSPDTGVSNGRCYVYTVSATDNVGNTTSVTSSPVLVDTVAPSDALTLNSVSGGVFKSGTTIYYKGNAAGSFKLQDAVSDAASGPKSATFGALAGGSGFSTHNSETISTPAGGPFVSTAISWTSASGSPTIPVNGTDNASNSSSATTYTLALDNSAPSGGSISVPGYVTSTSVAITSGTYSDGASGIAGGSNTITRSNGQSPVAGVCPGSGYTGSTVVTTPDTTVADGRCYVYTISATDNVGNIASISSSPVMVDTTAPAYASAALDAAGTHVSLTFTEATSGLDASASTPTSAFTVSGATVNSVFYTDSTHIRLTLASRLYGDATPTVAYNPGSLTAGQKVKDLAGNLLGSVSAQSISMTAVPSLTQSTVSASPTSITANGTSTSTITVRLKNAAGTNLATGGGTVTVAVGDGSLGSVTNNGDGTYTATLTSSTTAHGVTVTSKLDGSDLTSSAGVTYAPVASIDNGPSDPSASANATFDYSANDGAATFECSLDGAAYGACPGTGSGTTSFSALSTGTHTFDVRAKTATATGPAAHASWMVDTTAPTTSLTAPAAGTYVTTPTSLLTATAGDTGTGVSAVDFEYSSTPGASCSTGTWTLVGTDTTSTYGATWTTPADGSYAVRAVAHDGASHSTCSLVHVVVDETAPTASLTSPAANVAGTITLRAPGVADATSGINSVIFERAPHGTSTWTVVGNGAAQGGGVYTLPFDTIGVTDGDYDFRVTVTDVAGNVTQDLAGPVKVDNTPPATTLDPVATNVRQTIALSASASDAGSGVASSGFEISPHGASAWTSVPASFDTTTKTDGVYDLRSIATDAVGNVDHSTLQTLTIDNTAPVATLGALPQYARGPLALSSTTSDAGSGLATTRYERSAHGAGTWTTVTSPFDTSTVADGTYDFRVVAIDNAGNRTDSAVTAVTLDNTAPNASLDAPAGGAVVRGTIDLSSTVSDATSGIASIDYRAAATGTPEATPCDTWGNHVASHLDTTSLSDGVYDLRVVAVDNAGNGRCSSFTTNVRVDNTAPHTTDDAPAGPQNHDVNVHLSPSDSGSGVASTSYRVDSGPWQTGTTVVIPAAGNDGMHTIDYSSTDVAGNQESTHSTQVVVDTTAPTNGSGNGAAFARGDTVLTDSPTDTITKVEFFERAGASDPWTSIGDDSDGTDGWHVTWDTTHVSDGTYHLQMVETDDADNETTTPLADVVVDNTAPSSASVTVSGCGAECSGSNVTFTATADASVSGVGAVDFQVSVHGANAWSTVGTQASGFVLTWNSHSVADGDYDVRVGVTDKAGNGPTYSSPATITVDNNAPTVTVGAPANASGTVSLSTTGAADIDTVTYERRAHGGSTWTTIGSSSSAPFTVAFATGALADGQYDVRATAVDGGGNTGSDVKTVTVDNAAPTATLTAPAAATTVGGPNVALGATTNDVGTGVAQLTYQYRPSGGGSFTNISGSTWDVTAIASGSYDVRAEVTDAAGNVGHSTAVTVTVDSTPPALSLSGLAATLSGTVTVDANIAGAATARLQVAAAGSGAWSTLATDTASPFTFSLDTASLADGLYDIRVLADDAYGNEAVDTRTSVRVDNTAPTIVSSNPADGSVLAMGTTLSSLSFTASESLQSVTSVSFDGSPVSASPSVSGANVSVTLDAPVSDGDHWLTGVLTDTAGKTGPFRINATIRSANDTLVGSPAVAKDAWLNATTVLTSSDNTSTVTVPAASYTQPAGHTDDFLVLRIVPQATPISPMSGFSVQGSMVDVTLAWNSNGQQMHDFSQALQIDLVDPTGGTAVPATNQNGKWHLIPLLAGSTLPVGQADGFYRDANGIHILTHHLTLFTLVRDVAIPAAPRDFAGVVADDGLTLRWAPGIDQSQIQNFVLQVNRAPYQTFGSQQFETKLGAFTADDTRSFTITEVTTGGVSSAPTTPLLAVPRLGGRTVADAEVALAARGFTLGKQTAVVSSQPVGTVVDDGVRLLPAGSVVDVKVSGHTVPREAQFVMRIALRGKVSVTSHSLVARLMSTAPSIVAATLDGPGYYRIRHWKSFGVKAGANTHTLPLTRPLKPGTYTLYWLGRAKGGSLYRTQQTIVVKNA